MYFDELYLLLVVPALLISIFASIKVKTTFNKYNKIKVKSTLTSNEAVDKILRNNEIYDVEVKTVRGNLTDHYNPANKTLALSDSTAANNSVGAISVAAHEAGHAIQYKKNYPFVKLRTKMVPAVNIGSNLGMILIMIAFFIESAQSQTLLLCGIALYSITLVFTLVTLPVEFDASRRAMANLEGMGEMTADEIKGAKKVLSAAAFTYVAAMLTTLMTLIRFIMIAQGNGRRRR